MTPDTPTTRPYGVRWYEGFGEHDYLEASTATYATLPELTAALTSTAPETDVFQALVDGRQDTIHWIRDDLGFELFHADTDEG